jgi:hypothetical protein
MKRHLGCAIVVVGMSVLAAVPVVNARMGGGGAPIQQASPNHWGGYHGGGFHGGDRFHDHSDFFFFGAFPFWYPYYGSPYYYDYPPPYYYYDDYYAPRYYYDYGPSASSYNGQAPAYRVDDSRSYLVLGHDSGKGLMKKDVTWNWFVDYLQAYIVNAPSWARDDFQRGFVSGYGDGGESIYKKGLQQAQQPRPVSTESVPPSKPDPNSKQY